MAKYSLGVEGAENVDEGMCLMCLGRLCVWAWLMCLRKRLDMDNLGEVELGLFSAGASNG